MKKVITYGTFDLFHEGHFNILKRAKEYGDYLIVAVTGESYDCERGKLSVHDSIDTRIQNIKNTGLADEIIIEEYLGQKISDIIKNDVDTFVIGDDWRGKFDHLSQYCNLVYLERTQGISSTKIRQETFDFYKIGIISDDAWDGFMTKEANAVVGFDVSSVFIENKETLCKFQKKFPDLHVANSAEELINDVDIVYVRTDISKKFKTIKQALEAKKHVIANVPFTLDSKKQAELFNIAQKNSVLLIDNIKMVYLRLFFQMLWIVKGNLLGDIYSFKCSISYDNEDDLTDYEYMLTLSICVMIKLLGVDFSSMKETIKRTNSGEVAYASLAFTYNDVMAVIDIGNKVPLRNRLEIVGETGTLLCENEWWLPSYFEIRRPEAEKVEKYSSNFDGNGLKYILREMKNLLNNKANYSKCLFPDESIKIIEIMEKLI